MTYLIYLAVGTILALIIWGVERSARRERARNAAIESVLEEVNRINLSATNEIVYYAGQYFIRRPSAKLKGGYGYSFEGTYYTTPSVSITYFYVCRKGGITTKVEDRWTNIYRDALFMETLDSAKEVLESLSIKYISPKDGEVVYKEEPPIKLMGSDLILELIKAVEDKDKEKEIEILHALGHDVSR